MDVLKNHIKFNQLKSIFVALVFVFLSSCGLKVSSTGDHFSTVISGLVPSLLGSQSIYSSKLNSNAVCSHEAKLFKINQSGSIDESLPLATSVIDDSARYTFVIKNLNLDQENSKIEYLVKVYLCSGETLKRPVTDFNEKQDVDAKSTVISEVINTDALIAKKLNETNKAEIEKLMESLTGTTTSTVLNDLITNPIVADQFEETFGTNSIVLRDARPEINFNTMPLMINEETNSTYQVSAYHIDPNYSFAYRWKLNGIVKSSDAIWNFMPSANQSGSYTIDVYVGKDNGSGDIDLSKPYFTKSYNLVVYNSILPTAPVLTLNASTPSPRTTNSVQVDLTTGAGLSNCGSFSNLAITDSATVPGVMQFNISCTVSGTQTEAVTFSSNDGAKTLYLWAMDHVGVVSSPQTVNLVLDQTAPVVTSFVLNNGSSTATNPNISFALSGTDSVSAITHYQISESATTGPTWETFSGSGNYTVTQVNGNKSVYVRLKDAAGNISNSYVSNIVLDFGNPPQVTITSPVAGSTFTTGQNVPIQWNCSSTNGLDPNPARIRYTVDDGLSFVTISEWTTNNVSSTSGSYNWLFPAGVNTFRLLVECKSLAGVVTSAYSNPMNTLGWSIFAGDPSSMSENVNMSVALMARNTSFYQTMSADLQGNIYFEKNRAIMKIDSQTGLVTRFMGDPNYTGGTCNIQPGQDPLNSTYNKMSSNPYILGPSPDRNSFYFSVCGKTWSVNVSTKSLTEVYSAPFAQAGFLSRSGKYYFNSYPGKIYRVDLTVPGSTPVLLAGNSTTCTYPVAGVGTKATETQLLGVSDGSCAGETYFFTNHDETKLWVGNWDGYGRSTNSVELTWDSGQSSYLISNTNLGWKMNWEYGNCVPSLTKNRVFCSGRWSHGLFASYNFDTNMWEQSSIGRNVFIRYAAVNGGMVSLDSSNIVTSHIENSDGSINRFQIGGSNIEVYGNGSDLSKVAFSTVNDISFSNTTQLMYIRTAAGLRSINFSSYPNLSVQTPNWTGIGSSTGRLTISNDGTKLLFPVNWCGILGYNPYNISGLNISALTKFYNILGCNAGTRLAHPISDNTTISGNNFGWENLSNENNRPLLHSNGKQYLAVKNGTSDVVIYSSDRVTLRWIAGRSGAGGYDSNDHGQLAKTALLSDPSWISEIPSGFLNAGDLIVLDGSRLRLITVTTESVDPKIYDVFDLSSVGGYPNLTINDFWYDRSTELSNGTNNVVGSGKMYFVTSSNTVFKLTPLTVTGNTITSAQLTQYPFSDTIFSGAVRIALTPAGLLVTQPNKNRILRVEP